MKVLVKRTLLILVISMHLSACSMTQKQSPSIIQDKILTAKALIENALDENELGNKQNFFKLYRDAKETLQKSTLQAEKLRPENMPDTVFSLLQMNPAYYKQYSLDDLRSLINEAEKIMAQGESQDYPQGVIPGVWPLTREMIAKELEDMFQDWGEPSFEIDESLIRHVGYFYKFYSIYKYPKVTRAIERSKDYLNNIISTFSQYNLPEEVAFAVPFVESLFHKDIRSDANALGMFQLMPDTARLFGLKVNRQVDERTDYKRAGAVCARYLQKNRLRYSSLVLSIASYHHGTKRVERILTEIASGNKNSFEPIFNCKNIPRFGKASKEYIPQCLSAAIMYRYMKKKNWDNIPKVELKSRVLDEGIKLKNIGLDLKALNMYNPDLSEDLVTYAYAASKGYLLLTDNSFDKEIPMVKVPDMKQSKSNTVSFEEMSLAFFPYYLPYQR